MSDQSHGKAITARQSSHREDEDGPQATAAAADADAADAVDRSRLVPGKRRPFDRPSAAQQSVARRRRVQLSRILSIRFLLPSEETSI